ncbi:1-deoxy-D-xylulose 5-phosphate reductoisomerase [Vibrio cholerae]|nr:1-deoxy-D-xylulose 5-phosphate reductoisomerase [Vibrio cholerae]
MNLFIKTIKKTSLLSHSCLFIPHSVRKNILKMEIGGKKTTTHKAIVNKPSFQSQIEQKTQNTYEALKKQRKKA